MTGWIMTKFCPWNCINSLQENAYIFWYKSVISSVEVYNKQIITCNFSYHTLYQPSFIYHPSNLLALRLIKSMIWKMPCNNLYLFYLVIFHYIESLEPFVCHSLSREDLLELKHPTIKYNCCFIFFYI